MSDDQVITPRAKSSCSNTGANRVETARTASGSVAVPDSKSSGGALVVSAPAWGAFVSAIKDETFSPG